MVLLSANQIKWLQRSYRRKLMFDIRNSVDSLRLNWSRVHLVALWVQSARIF
ncbi:hypothetical protein Pcar_3337 [Syntrophotalea carbinolica DSM 2380]|uniref:Uncharacterized protein n=1 Tax=Syntrophotalea carbinolica (strain DSM 2380 / NBRC 103641 / GraBd1) TaxID=338963 RepID=Q0C6I5_SYNC1|nr:hypothetical protein Pcar_3337 [Syntrophotalea carbinolica DSM 2380]